MLLASCRTYNRKDLHDRQRSHATSYTQETPARTATKLHHVYGHVTVSEDFPSPSTPAVGLAPLALDHSLRFEQPVCRLPVTRYFSDSDLPQNDSLAKN